MNVISLTRELVDIESVTGNEAKVGRFLYDLLSTRGYALRRIPVENERFNVLALPPNHSIPSVVFATHMDTVPPFTPSSEDTERIYGRGSCDAKGIIAAQIEAAERLLAERVAVGLLFLVGEERDNAGAKAANLCPVGSEFLINGEPTENRLAIASKGALQVQIRAQGRMSHSAYPELGESAIDKLLEALQRLQSMRLPTNPEVGPTTMNIGLIQGGRAPNVVADQANAQVLFRTIGPTDKLRKQILEAVGTEGSVEFVTEVPFIKLNIKDSWPAMVASFFTDIPALSNWGRPFLMGPGCIHLAHTDHEHVLKEQLVAGVEAYVKLVKDLRTQHLGGNGQ